MNLLLLVGMFVCSGCGNTPYTPYPAATAIVDYSVLHMVAAWDGADKAHTGNGNHWGAGGSLRFGHPWFVGPGADWSRQTTEVWTKDAVYASVAGGYRTERGEAWLSASVPVTGASSRRVEVSGGAQVQTDSGLLFSSEIGYGSYPGGHYTSLSFMAGWRFR